MTLIATPPAPPARDGVKVARPSLDDLIAGFWQAASGGGPWERALGGVARSFGAGAVVLHHYDLAQGRLDALQAAGPRATPAALYDYAATWGAHDPRKARSMAAGPDGLGRWFHCHEAFDDAYVRRNAYYQHYILPYGVRHNANVTLPLGPTTGCAFVMELDHDRGPLDEGERDEARRLGEQLSEALQAHERLRRLAAQALAAQPVLEGLPHPVWLIDADRLVLSANAAARAQPHATGLRDGRLVLRANTADRALANQLRRLTQADPPSRFSSPHALSAAAARAAAGADPQGRHGRRAVVDARLRPSDAPLWLHLGTVLPQAVMGAFGDRPAVVATLFDATRLPELDPFALAELFGLTPAQARVAAALPQGRTAAQMAADLGCAESTVRTHLRAVCAQLGVRRLQEAVAWLSRAELLWSRPGSGSPPTG